MAYDAWSKHHAVLGPLNMGLCRGANLALGAAVAGPSGLLMAGPPAALVTALVRRCRLISLRASGRTLTDQESRSIRGVAGPRRMC